MTVPLPLTVSPSVQPQPPSVSSMRGEPLYPGCVVPSMTIVATSVGSAEVMAIGCSGVRLKPIVQGAVQTAVLASMMAWRNVPAPLSAEEVTVMPGVGVTIEVITVDESFEDVGSPMLEVTDAVFDTDVGEPGAVTLTVIGLAVPTERDAIVQ